MRSGFVKWMAMVLVVLALLVTTGCAPWILASQALSFAAGWTLRDVTMPTTTETTCYVNGVQVDCSQLP